MKFDKSRVYTAVNADELAIGSKCILGDTIQDLRQKIQGGFCADDCAEDYFRYLSEIYDDDRVERFVANDCAYIYAYLIEPPTEKKYKPFESVEEAMKAIKAHGGWVKNMTHNSSYAVVAYYAETVETSQYIINLETLLDNYVFADDGSPCGMLVEE